MTKEYLLVLMLVTSSPKLTKVYLSTGDLSDNPVGAFENSNLICNLGRLFNVANALVLAWSSQLSGPKGYHRRQIAPFDYLFMSPNV